MGNVKTQLRMSNPRLSFSWYRETLEIFHDLFMTEAEEGLPEPDDQSREERAMKKALAPDGVLPAEWKWARLELPEKYRAKHTRR